MKLVLLVASVWIPASAAIIAGLYFTHNINCLWFLLIPAMLRFRED